MPEGPTRRNAVGLGVAASVMGFLTACARKVSPSPTQPPTPSHSPTPSPTPTATQAFCAPKEVTGPWGGEVYANYSFGQGDIHDVEHVVRVLNDPGVDSHLYLQLYDANIDSHGQYFGLQTNGLAIFSVFGIDSHSAVRQGPNSQVDIGSEQGSKFISVRASFGSLTPGTYKTRVIREEAEGNGDWFGYYVLRPGQSSEDYVGSIRFPRSRSTTRASFADGGGSWLEAWDNSQGGTAVAPVARWAVSATAAANGQRPRSITTSYCPEPDKDTQNSDLFANKRTGEIQMIVGTGTCRTHQPDDVTIDAGPALGL